MGRRSDTTDVENDNDAPLQAPYGPPEQQSRRVDKTAHGRQRNSPTSDANNVSAARNYEDNDWPLKAPYRPPPDRAPFAEAQLVPDIDEEIAERVKREVQEALQRVAVNPMIAVDSKEENAPRILGLSRKEAFYRMLALLLVLVVVAVGVVAAGARVEASAAPSPLPSEFPSLAPSDIPVDACAETPNGEILGNWTECTNSYQCSNGCCSGEYSNGTLKCTPLDGGCRSDLCV